MVGQILVRCTQCSIGLFDSHTVGLPCLLLARDGNGHMFRVRCPGIYVFVSLPPVDDLHLQLSHVQSHSRHVSLALSRDSLISLLGRTAKDRCCPKAWYHFIGYTCHHPPSNHPPTSHICLHSQQSHSTHIIFILFYEPASDISKIVTPTL